MLLSPDLECLFCLSLDIELNLMQGSFLINLLIEDLSLLGIFLKLAKHRRDLLVFTDDPLVLNGIPKIYEGFTVIV